MQMLKLQIRTSPFQWKSEARSARCSRAGFITGAMILLLMAGCTTPLKLLSQKRVPATYQPAREPMLVMVENFGNPSISRFDADQLVRQVHYDLARHRVAPLVEPAELQRLRDQRTDDFRMLSTAAIGRDVGARQVLYIDLVEANLAQAIGSDLARGQMSVLVRIIDVETGESRWPDTAEGYPIHLETPPLRLASSHDEMAVRQRMSELMSGRIVRLFITTVQ
jgi:hypothetical protein